jgi:hypothetical protein
MNQFLSYYLFTCYMINLFFNIVKFQEKGEIIVMDIVMFVISPVSSIGIAITFMVSLFVSPERIVYKE